MGFGSFLRYLPDIRTGPRLTRVGVDWDSRKRRNAIFRITGPGKHEEWSQRVDNELGNYDYLLGESEFRGTATLRF
jgi:hypothetical protein